MAEVITANAGSSVLTECNKKLHDEFGVLALINSPNHLSNLADYYISNSADGLKRFVHLRLNAVIVDTGESNNLYISDFKKQIAALGLKSIVFSKTKESGLKDFAGTNLPSKSFNSLFSLDAESVLDILNGKSIVSKASEAFGITEYVMHIMTEEELEYLIFGNPSSAINKENTRNLIFAMKCIVNCAEEIEDPIMWAVAIARSWKETDEVMKSPEELSLYLRAMISVLSSSNKLAYRIMDIMQLTIGDDFLFEDYCYGFDIIAQYSRGNKNGIVNQTHRYTD